MTIKKYENKRFVPVTLQLIVGKLDAINKTAYSLEIPRHRLLTKAIEVELPLVVASLKAKQNVKEG